MKNMIKRVAKVYGISEGEVELEIYRMIGEQIRTGTDVSKKMWKTFICMQDIKTTQELVEKLFETMMGLGIRTMQGRIDAEHVVKEMMEKIKGEQDPKEEPQITDSDLENDENIQAMFAVCCSMASNL